MFLTAYSRSGASLRRLSPQEGHYSIEKRDIPLRNATGYLEGSKTHMYCYNCSYSSFIQGTPHCAAPEGLALGIQQEKRRLQPSQGGRSGKTVNHCRCTTKKRPLGCCGTTYLESLAWSLATSGKAYQRW